MSETTYYQKNRDIILNRAKDYYNNNINVLRERAKNRYRELPEEEKNKKREYTKNRYHNMSEEDKQKRISDKISCSQKTALKKSRCRQIFI